MKKYLMLLFAVSCAVCACSGGDEPTPDVPNIPIGPDGTDTTKKVEKSIQMWVDAHANFSRLANKPTINLYLDKMKETGFNEVYVDVKPGIGHALYDSDILPKLTQWGSETVNRDWDYLGYFIEEAEKRDIAVIASISTLGFGVTSTREGLVYNDPRWDGKTQVVMKDAATPNVLTDMRDETSVDAAMLDPCYPEVQTFVISIVEEIVTKYPKLKGICLDYCRYYSANHGFGVGTMAAFEAFIGEPVASNSEIITLGGGMGPKYAKWIEFRSTMVSNLIAGIRSRVKSIHPEMELHLWASAQWSSRYGVGQNWASKRYIPSGGAYTSTYNQTGFADQIDVFSLGAYADAVWKKDRPQDDWSVENFVMTYDKYTMGDCKVCGSLGMPAYGQDINKISDAVYLCLKYTDGLMCFELGHVINNNQWAAIKAGIQRVVK